jgi:FkbM family methyltransferase
MSTLFQQLKAKYEAGGLTKAEFIIQMHERLHSTLFAYAEQLEDADIARIEISAGRVIMTSRRDGIRIVVDPEDHRTAPIEILNFGEYEPEEAKVIRRIADKMDTMFDIGANIGWYSLMAAKINPRSIIHSFEPIPTTYGRLLQNFALNSIESPQCHNYGFSNEPGSFPFYFYPEGSGNASMQNLAGRKDVTIVNCELRTLDSVLDWLPSNNMIDFIKCDVEGNELFVLKGGLKLLMQHKPILLCELLRKWSASFGYHPNEAINLLRGIGYDVYTVSTDGRLIQFSLITESTIHTNFFFVHPESRLCDQLLFNISVD